VACAIVCKDWNQKTDNAWWKRCARHIINISKSIPDSTLKALQINRLDLLRIKEMCLQNPHFPCCGIEYVLPNTAYFPEYSLRYDIRADKIHLKFNGKTFSYISITGNAIPETCIGIEKTTGVKPEWEYFFGADAELKIANIMKKVKLPSSVWLPNEMITKILLLLSPEELVLKNSVCRQWHEAINSDLQLSRAIACLKAKVLEVTNKYPESIIKAVGCALNFCQLPEITEKDAQKIIDDTTGSHRNLITHALMRGSGKFSLSDHIDPFLIFVYNIFNMAGQKECSIVKLYSHDSSKNQEVNQVWSQRTNDSANPRQQLTTFFSYDFAKGYAREIESIYRNDKFITTIDVHIDDGSFFGRTVTRECYACSFNKS
jgi:hypothetical protein